SQLIGVYDGCRPINQYFTAGTVIGHVYPNDSGAVPVYQYNWNSDHYYSQDGNDPYGQQYYTSYANSTFAMVFEVW
nr:hypothetical protein [Acidimicrobiia bacterium]